MTSHSLFQIHDQFVIYRDPEYFAAWPFNGGLWQFADGELLLGFVRGRCDYNDGSTLSHAKTDCENGEHVTLRSRDGGRTWPLETLQTIYTRPALDDTLRAQTAATISENSFNPRSDGFCLLSVFGIPPRDENAIQNLCGVFVSEDRGRTWSTPVRLPDYGFTHLGGRPSYCLNADGVLLLFAHASRSGGPKTESGAFPVVFGSTTGGASWNLVGEIELSPRPWSGSGPMGIMPAPLLLADGTILIAVRRQYSTSAAFTQIYESRDGGGSWNFKSRVNLWGAPATLTLLPDNRIVCVYGYRNAPFGVRAKVSSDNGASWGEEIVLRDDGQNWDVGYPRTIVRPDGKLFTAYYFTDKKDRTPNGGVRFIAGTIWEV